MFTSWFVSLYFKLQMNVFDRGISAVMISYAYIHSVLISSNLQLRLPNIHI